MFFTPIAYADDPPYFKSELFKTGTLVYSDDFKGEYNRERWGATKKDRLIKDGKLIVTARFTSKEKAMKSDRLDSDQMDEVKVGDTITTAYGVGKLQEQRYDMYNDDLTTEVSVIALDFGATLYQPVVVEDQPSEPASQEATSNIEIQNRGIPQEVGGEFRISLLSMPVTRTFSQFYFNSSARILSRNSPKRQNSVCRGLLSSSGSIVVSRSAHDPNQRRQSFFRTGVFGSQSTFRF